MKEMCGRWKWICEVERRRRGHCTSLLEGSNRKDSLRECLIELNLEFHICFSFLAFFLTSSISICFLISIQICTAYLNDSVEFVRVEELKEPSVRYMERGVGMKW